MSSYLQGLTLGLAYVAPIGLQNLFVINTALTHPRRRALLTALIVIFFDVSLALTCFFGIGAIIQRYAWLQMTVLLLGSLIVIWIGIDLFRSKPEEPDRSVVSASIRKMISTACVVTWFNPQAIIDGTMLLGAFHAALPPSQAVFFISGVASASCLWFTGLTLLISLLSNHFHAKTLRWINLVCGAVIVFYGAKLLLSFFAML